VSSVGAPPVPGVPRVRRSLKARPSRADLAFHQVATASGIAVLVIMLLVGSFLAFRAATALDVAGLGFFTETRWEPDAHHFGIAGVLTGTVLVGLVAVTLAVPLATATALYISEYAPARLQRTLISLVDLMAAVPSVVFGLFGFFLFQYKVGPLAQWIAENFGWIPIFDIDVEGYQEGSALTQTRFRE